jgi:hypothetical protein
MITFLLRKINLDGNMKEVNVMHHCKSFMTKTLVCCELTGYVGKPLHTQKPRKSFPYVEL